MPTKPKPIGGDLQWAKRYRLKLLKTAKDTPLGRRRKAEKIARLDEFIGQEEIRLAQKAHEAREAAYQQQLKDNAARLKAETEAPKQQTAAEVEENLARIAGHPLPGPNATEQKRKVFYFVNSDEYYFRGAYEALVPAKIKKLANGYVDAQDGESVEVVDVCPQPCRGAVLLDDGDWRLPEVKHPVIGPPPRERNESMVGWRPDPRKEPAERLVAKIREKGFQVQMTPKYEIFCLYDFQWIPFAQWKALMNIEI